MSTSLVNAAGILLRDSAAQKNTIGGTIAAETLIGTPQNDYIVGKGGGDTLIGLGGDDIYQLSSQNDVVIEDAGAGVDTVIAYLPFYTLPDNVENLRANSNTMWATGNAMDNIIRGASGHQVLEGGYGNDILFGGAGADTFIIRAGEGSDIINDFSTSTLNEYVRLDKVAFKSFADVQSHMTQVGADVVIALSETETLTLRDVNAADLRAAHFALPFETTGLTLTFADEFDTLSLYDAATRSGTWSTTFGLGNENTTSVRTISGSYNQQLFVDPAFTGRGTEALGLNPFSIQDGVLTITATNTPTELVEAASGYEITSGLLTTRSTFVQQYGYFEMRARLPDEVGAWPAFWLLPANGGYLPEIDIMEAVDGNPIAYTTTHYNNGSSKQSQGAASQIYDTDDGFHTFGMLWSDQTMQWYVDGALVLSIPTPAAMNAPMYIIANLAIGGGWANYIDANSPVDIGFDIDYIRAYEIDDAPWLAGRRTHTDTAANNTFTLATAFDKFTGPGGGVDTLQAGFSYTLLPAFENLTLTGSATADGVGTSYNNVLRGNAGTHTLRGLGGDDTLYAGTGTATLIGGSGNDVYILGKLGDIVSELPSQGTDTVKAGFSYSLTQGVENLVLTGTSGGLSGMGNDLDNVLTATAGDNTLNGAFGNDRLVSGSGDDTLIGSFGNDMYVVNSIGDQTIELYSGGTDSVQSKISWTLADNVENLSLTGAEAIDGTGNDLANRIIGNTGNNSLAGGGGNDSLVGGLGQDTMTGGSGADLFQFRTGYGTDIITDFSLAEKDKLDLAGLVPSSAVVSYDAGTVTAAYASGDTLVLCNQSEADYQSLLRIYWGG